ncbi:AraC family transcriptional regulator [Kitasatospora purpeofusca]|uniref:AraC family transcriptional regulator n=1 Tax=Kitasatospora purpeofusca TaxID=67352 RepID=UPI002A59E238|nr:AraC family transcriptional regulator [Kitasatospora purpeofusca]MDY0816473.1 AraC family transcriptional regulator [Kitasatospora purpeofusca]
MSSSSYAERPPGAAPGRQVACVWVRRNAVGPEYGQLVVPDGCVDLVWSAAGLEVVGPDRAPRTVPVPGGAELAGVRFRPGAAGLLLGAMPARELCDLQVPLADVAGAGVAERLGERLAEQRAVGLVERDGESGGKWGEGRRARVRGPAEVAALLDAFVASRVPGWTPDRVVERAVAALGRPKGVRLADLAAELGLSERQLRRRVTDAVGYGPKTLHAVLRFRRAVARARPCDHGGGGGGCGGGRGDGGAVPGLAEVAALAGYADQAHLTREVRRWSGVSPTVLLGRAVARPGQAPPGAS